MTTFPFDRPKSQELNQARLAHLDSLGLDLWGKRVLEPGSGIGLLTSFWEERGCDVLSTEGREGNIAENLRRHPWRAGRVLCVDLETPGSHDHLGQFDVVFLYGTLYHVHNPHRVLEDLARVCSGLLLVEVRAHPSDDGQAHRCGDSDGLDQALHQKSCRPARNWVLTQLRLHFRYAYVTVKQPRHPEFPLHWPSGERKVRAVFVASRFPLGMDTLSEKLLTEQEPIELGA